MVVQLGWQTTPEELRAIADKLDSKCTIKTWGQDTVVTTIELERVVDVRIQLSIGLDINYWNKRVKNLAS